MSTELKTKVKKWLTDEGLFEKEIQDDQVFHLVINFPENQVSPMDIVQPKGKDDSIIILCTVNLMQNQIERMKNLSAEERLSFIMEFIMKLSEHHVLFNLLHPENVLQKYAIQVTIFEDGLTKDKLMSTIIKLNSVKTISGFMIQKRFGFQ